MKKHDLAARPTLLQKYNLSHAILADHRLKMPSRVATIALLDHWNTKKVANASRKPGRLEAGWIGAKIECALPSGQQ